MSDNSVHIVTKPSLFNQDLYITQVPEGITIRDIVGPNPFEGVRVEVNGQVIEAERWETHQVVREDLVNIMLFPAGGGGGGDKNPLKMVAMIAVMVMAPYAGGAMMGALGLEGAIVGGLTWGAVGTGLAMTAGMMAVNALIPPQLPEAIGGRVSVGSPANSYSITGGQNRANPYGVVQKVYGFVRYFPNLAAKYYTEIRGNEQYFHMLLCAGYANVNLSELRIGETAIGDFDDVQTEIGYMDQITIFRNNVVEESVSAKIAQGEDVVRGIEDGQTNHDISIDVSFPQGLRSVSDEGAEGWAEVQIRVEVSEKDAGSYTTAATQTYRTTKKDPIRENISFTTTTTGEGIDIRVTNTLVSHAYSKYTFSDCYVTAVRSILRTPPVNDPDRRFKFIAVEIRATDQINGVVDNVSVLGKSLLPVWTGTAWEYQESNNCSWAYVEACHGDQLAHPVPESKIDESEMLAWATWCTDEGFTYNNVHDSRITMLEYLRIIASTGRAQWAIQDGLFSVIRDTAQSVRTQMITPRNSWGFSAKKYFPDPPHALKVKYRNPVSGDQDVRMVYADGYTESTATQFEELPTVGVDDADQAWKTGRYHLADIILRPEDYTVNMDFENLKARRGSLVGLSHDVMLVGIAWGRIKQVISSTQIETDEKLPFESGKSYVIRFRKNDNTQEMVTATGIVGYNTTIDLGSAVSGLNQGDLFTFGIAGEESIDAKVKAIEYYSDLSAKLTLVPAAPEILNADQGTIPAYDPVMTAPINPLVMTPQTPEFVMFETFESLGGTTVITQTIVGFMIKSGQPLVDKVEVRYRYDGTWKTVSADAIDGIVQILDVPAAGTSVDYQIRARSVHNVWCQWSATTSHTVAFEKTILPDAVTGFAALPVQDGIKLSWDHLPALQIKEYKIRKGSSFATGTTVFEGLSSDFTDTDKSDGARQYWIVSVDSGGRISTPVSESVTVLSPSDPVINYNLSGSIAQLAWDACATTFPIRHYRVVSGADIHFITNVQYAETITWTGSKDITVQAFDIGGNTSNIITQAVVSPNAPAVTSLTATGGVHSIILNVGYAWTNPEEIKLIEIWEATSNNRSTASLIKTLEPGKHAYIRPGVELLENRYYWARLQNRADVHSEFYPAGSTSGVAGTPSSDADDYIKMFDAIISEGDLVSQFTWTSMKDFFEWEGTGRYTIQDGNEAIGLANAVVKGLGAIEERLSVIDTANAPDYDSGTVYSIGQVVNYEGGFHRKKLAGPAGIAPSNVTYWQSMAAGILNQWVMKMNANGHVAGVGLSLNDSGDSEFIIQADKFAVVTDNPAAPGTPVSMFQVGLVNGVTMVGLRGDLMLDGTVGATAMKADDIFVGLTIQSSNYVAGVSGWKINKDGNMELNGGGLVITGGLPADQIDGELGGAYPDSPINFPGVINSNPDGSILKDEVPAGWFSVYNSAVTRGISYDETEGALLLHSATENQLNMACSAFPVTPGATYRIAIKYRCDVDHSADDGFYLGYAEYDGEMPDGKYCVGWTSGVNPPETQVATRGSHAFISNEGVDDSYVEREFEYTPTDTAKYASIVIWKWTALGTDKLFVKYLKVTSKATDNSAWAAPGDSTKINGSVISTGVIESAARTSAGGPVTKKDLNNGCDYWYGDNDQVLVRIGKLS